MTTDHFKFTLKIIFTLFLYLSLSLASSLIYFILAHLNVIDVLDIRKGERLSSVNRKFVWMSLVFFSLPICSLISVCASTGPFLANWQNLMGIFLNIYLQFNLKKRAHNLLLRVSRVSCHKKIIWWLHLRVWSSK